MNEEWLRKAKRRAAVMESALVPPPTHLPSPPMSFEEEELAEEAQQIIALGVPENTRRTYRSQWMQFLSWCRLHSRSPLPASSETLVLYLTDRARSVKTTTLNVALAAITVAHREAGHLEWSATDLPGVRVFMRGLRRSRRNPVAKKRAFVFAELMKGLPRGAEVKDVRDRALLLVGFFSALRRSELVGLDLEDVTVQGGGVRLFIARSKSDKDSAGQVAFVPALRERPDACPVAALETWLESRGSEPGPLFTSLRSGLRLPEDSVSEVVKAAAKRAGLDPADFGGHSLRSGFATSAAQVEAEERDIMRVTRHRSVVTVREYIQEAELGRTHPGRKIAARSDPET